MLILKLVIAGIPYALYYAIWLILASLINQKFFNKQERKRFKKLFKSTYSSTFLPIAYVIPAFIFFDVNLHPQSVLEGFNEILKPISILIAAYAGWCGFYFVKYHYTRLIELPVSSIVKELPQDEREFY